jgi:hypothetical protein
MPRCKELAARSLALARTLRSDSTLLGALAATLYSLTGADDVDALLSASEEVFAVERRRGRLTWFSAEAHLLRYHAFLHKNERAEADRALADFGEVAGRLRLPEPMLLYQRLCAQRIFDEGRLCEAEELFIEQHARGKRLGLAYADVYYGVHRAMLDWERSGANEPAVPDVDGWAIANTPGFRATRLFRASEAGRGMELKHQWELLCQDDFAAVPRDQNYLFTLAQAASVAVELGDVPRARQLYERLAPYARRGTPSLLSTTAGSVAHYLGLLAEFLGEHGTAAAHFEMALADNDRMAFAPWAARTRVRYASLLLTQDGAGRTRARELLHEAQEAARRIGLGPVARRADALLERAGR